jgi:hypothetical protein
MVARRHNWGEERLFYYDREGRLKSFPASVTDMAPIDAFVQISGGRSAFRADDLLELRGLLDRHDLAAGGQKDV